MPRTFRLLSVVLLGACATTQTGSTGDGAMRALESARLERAVLDAASSRGLGTAAPRSVRIATRREIACAVCIGATRHCVAFLSAAELARLRGFIPRSETPDALISVPGASADQGAQVLVLAQEDFRYQPDAQRVSEAEPGVHEIEDRARRRVTDWLTWLSSQGALPR